MFNFKFIVIINLGFESHIMQSLSITFNQEKFPTQNNVKWWPKLDLYFKK